MPKGYHHVTREQRSQISALKAIATPLNKRLFSKIYGWMVAPQVYQAGDRALSASSPVF